MTLDRGPHDRQLARRLTRDARVAAKARLRAQFAHAKAVRRRERAIARARRHLPVQLLVALASGVASLPLHAPWAWLAMVTSGAAGVGAYRSVQALRSPPVGALPGAQTVPPPPHPRSAAFPAVRRLEVVLDELRRLLPLVAPGGRDVAEQAWRAAAEADGALRWQAARLSAVEPHRGVEDALLRPLYDGVACQERLLGAVADLVAASADPLATQRLQDATDALHGLAQGLRKLR